MSYRFKRRAFLSALGGAVGLHTMLENLEAAESGRTSPPRLLATAWPVGTIRYHYLPTGGNRDFTMSRILMPFETAGLRDDLVILYGLNHSGLSSNGGGPEAGTVFMMTGADSPGCRNNGGEQDDSVAGGPSFDQIFLKHVQNLQRTGKGYANAIGDARVDSNETSTQCFSYSHVTRQIESSRPGGPIIENTPLLPALDPIALYTELFSSFVPGGGDAEQMVKELRLKKSVLDGALRQLARLGELAPASERIKIDVHTEAVRKLERRLSDLLDQPGGCLPLTAPDASIRGQFGSRFAYNNPVADEPDAPLVEQIGKLHLATIRTAFQCDLIRVATFAWTPSQPHMAIANLDPTDPEVAYMHHPLSHRVTMPSFVDGPPPDSGANDAFVYEALVRANTWYFERYAEVFAEWKTATDAFGGSLLDHTVIPMMTDTASAIHARSPLPALILGGKALGMQGGQFHQLQGGTRPHNDLWLTIAQAFLPDSPDILQEFPDEVFERRDTSVIEGLWTRPT